MLSSVHLNEIITLFTNNDMENLVFFPWFWWCKKFELNILNGVSFYTIFHPLPNSYRDWHLNTKGSSYGNSRRSYLAPEHHHCICYNNLCSSLFKDVQIKQHPTVLVFKDSEYYEFEGSIDICSCKSYDFALDYHARLLTITHLEQGYVSTRFKSSLLKFYGHHHELVDCYSVSIYTMKTDLFNVS